jgi:UDP-glucoronosyl and UDP-glucosyl transferase
MGVQRTFTTGPAIDPDQIAAPPNVRVVRSAPHTRVLRHAAAVVTHGGHGTVAKTLAAGVPLLTLQLGRDQPDVAARVVAAGAGLRVPRDSSAERIADDVVRLLAEPAFRASAGRLAADHPQAREGSDPLSGPDSRGLTPDVAADERGDLPCERRPLGLETEQHAPAVTRDRGKDDESLAA